MSYKLADGTLSTDYKVGDLFKVVDTTDNCADTRNGDIILLDEEDDKTSCPFFIRESDSILLCCCWSTLEKYEQQPELYTESELTEIEELRDRVDYLEDLCSEYSKTIWELKHKLLAQSNNSVVSIEREFKPIKDMVIIDWEQALDEGWEFETVGEGIVTLDKLDTEDVGSLPIRVCNDEGVQWLTIDGVGTDNSAWTIRARVK